MSAHFDCILYNTEKVVWSTKADSKEGRVKGEMENRDIGGGKCDC